MEESVKLRISTNYNNNKKEAYMLSIKEIKKVMKEFGKTADEALDFLIKIERAKKELQEQPVTKTETTKPVFPVVDIPLETKEEQPKKDEDDTFIDTRCNTDTFERALAEGEARACPWRNTDEIKQKLEKLPRTNPRVKKYLEAAESWLEYYSELYYEYYIPSTSITSIEPTDKKAAEESRKNAIYAFIAPLVEKAEKIAEQPNDVNPVFSAKDVQSFYDSLGEED
jgi:hypothetical protein